MDLLKVSATPLVPATTDFPFDRLVSITLNSVHSDNTRKAYKSALLKYFAWWESHDRPPLTRETVHDYRTYLQQSGKEAPSINSALAALKRLANEARELGVISEGQLSGIRGVTALAVRGKRAGNWLSAEETLEMIEAPEEGSLMGWRDRAVLALLFGTGLRRDELTKVRLSQYAIRDGRRVIIDVEGKGNKIRTVAVHEIAAQHAGRWIAEAKLLEPDQDGEPAADGPLLRPLTRSKPPRVVNRHMDPRTIYLIANKYPAFNVNPHDCRRTLAKLMRDAGAPLEDIQDQLGHADVSTTVRYLGRVQKLRQGEAAVDYAFQKGRL